MVRCMEASCMYFITPVRNSQISMQNLPLPCFCDQFNQLYRPDLKLIHSGCAESDHAFQNHYELQIPDLDLTCIRCCLFFLQSRGYSVTGVGYNFVLYLENKLAPWVDIPAITAFLNIPKGGGKRGQIATGYDYNIGARTARSFARSRTYQMYTPTGVLSVGFCGRSRMESVAIDVVETEELKDIKVNYAAAVLIEQYRLKIGKPTLFGCCLIR